MVITRVGSNRVHLLEMLDCEQIGYCL